MQCTHGFCRGVLLVQTRDLNDPAANPFGAAGFVGYRWRARDPRNRLRFRYAANTDQRTPGSTASACAAAVAAALYRPSLYSAIVKWRRAYPWVKRESASTSRVLDVILACSQAMH